MNVQGVGGRPELAKLLGQGGFDGVGAFPGAPGQAGVPSQIASIQNDKGQSLVDIRDELQSAVKGALQGLESGEDPRAAVQGAIQTTLEDNGFDPQQVRGAMQDAGFNPMGARGFGGGAMPAFAAGIGGGFDPSSTLASGGSEEDMIEMFLRQFRAGTNLDLEI